MLLEFRIENFRSIRDEQVLSLVASSADKGLHATHLVPTGLKPHHHAVRTAVVYGPNASGKSNLLRGLDYMRAVVAESATVVQPGAAYNVQPFRLDATHAQLPTQFEVTFLLGGVRHQYAFAMTAQRIVSESLVVYRSSKPAQWFSRTLNDDASYDYVFSSQLTGPRKLWQDSTRPNALFLSTAAQLNSEALSPVFRWVVDTLFFLPAHASFDEAYTTAMLATQDGRAQIRDFLAAADISISDVQAVPRKGVLNQVVFQAGALPHTRSEEREVLVPLFHHVTASGQASFELQDESEGTQRLYSLVAPLLDVLQKGRVLLVDELDSSLHPLLVRRLLAMFHDPQFNSRGAQLVFTTHDTTLLDHSLLRRDQIWFTEKDADQATRLYPLTDFSPRNREAWERGYLQGRYGAVPFFSSVLTAGDKAANEPPAAHKTAGPAQVQ